MDTDMNVQMTVDAKGLKCPMPVLKAKKALADLQSGELLCVLTTDPGSVRDFQAFSKQTGNELICHDQDMHGYTFIIKRR